MYKAVTLAGGIREPLLTCSSFIAGRPKAAILFCLLLVVLLLARFIVVSVLSICLVCNFSIVATCPSIQLPALLFVCVCFCCL